MTPIRGRCLRHAPPYRLYDSRRIIFDVMRGFQPISSTRIRPTFRKFFTSLFLAFRVASAGPLAGASSSPARPPSPASSPVPPSLGRGVSVAPQTPAAIACYDLAGAYCRAAHRPSATRAAYPSSRLSAAASKPAKLLCPVGYPSSTRRRYFATRTPPANDSPARATQPEYPRAAPMGEYRPR